MTYSEENFEGILLKITLYNNFTSKGYMKYIQNRVQNSMRIVGKLNGHPLETIYNTEWKEKKNTKLQGIHKDGRGSLQLDQEKIWYAFKHWRGWHLEIRREIHFYDAKVLLPSISRLATPGLGGAPVPF